MSKKIYIPIIIILIILVTSGIYLWKKGDKTINLEENSNEQTSIPPVISGLSNDYLQLGDKKISLFIADTPELQEKGLGGRESLPTDTAMLFVFDRPDLYGIWMKDMKFPIDVVWFDDQYQIVHIEENISPETFPETYFTSVASTYVLEAKAGFVQENNLAVGNSLNFHRGE